MQGIKVNIDFDSISIQPEYKCDKIWATDPMYSKELTQLVKTMQVTEKYDKIDTCYQDMINIAIKSNNLLVLVIL